MLVRKATPEQPGARGSEYDILPAENRKGGIGTKISFRLERQTREHQ
jgi:hypothetical protein